MIRILLFIVSVVSASVFASEEHPDCSAPGRYAPTMAYVHLKNEGITSPTKLDFDKTVSKLVASQEIKKGLFRQVHKVVFTEKSGPTIKVLTINDASHEECSMSEVEVHVILKSFGDL